MRKLPTFPNGRAMSPKDVVTWQMLRAGWVTSLESGVGGGHLALSQRLGEWSGYGVKLHEKWVNTDRGARVKAWRLASAPRKPKACNPFLPRG